MADEQSSIITASSKPTNEGNSVITASSKPGFVPNITKEVKPVAEEPKLTEGQVEKVVKDTFKEAMLEKVTPEAEREAAKLFKTLLQSNLNNFKAGDVTPGNMLFYRYDAKNKEQTYDKTPLVLVLKRSRGYVLGLNLHWTPVPLRITLLKLILKFNKTNIMKGYPIQFTYEMVKPFIMKMGLGPVIRLYIFNRISRRGLVVPVTMWLQAAKLRAESFSGGKSADQLYQQAIKKYRQGKINRGRREHTWK
jgi:hypothetical protein